MRPCFRAENSSQPASQPGLLVRARAPSRGERRRNKNLQPQRAALRINPRTLKTTLRTLTMPIRKRSTNKVHGCEKQHQVTQKPAYVRTLERSVLPAVQFGSVTGVDLHP